MKRYLPFLIVAVVALATIIGGTMLYRVKRVAVSPATKLQNGVERRGERIGHILGKTDAPVVLEEFGDFECPPCGRLSEPINQIERDYRGQVCVLFHNFPLPSHKHAHEAAQAAEAAAMQGRFWQMHDVLYREQGVWSIAPDVFFVFKTYAGTIGLDLAQFERDYASEEVKKRIAADQQQAAVLGVSTTPSIFINDQPVPVSELNHAGLRTAVDAALKAKGAKAVQ
jgi:protein-disulfide isomerase